MASTTVVKRRAAILELLRDENVKEVTLTGRSGVGKTWTAKLVSEDALKERLFDIALWVFLDGVYNEAAVRESIARQLSLLPFAEEWESGDMDNKEAEIVENNESLRKKIAESIAGKKLLLILDYEGKTEENVEHEKSELDSLADEEKRASEPEELILDSKQNSLESDSLEEEEEEKRESKPEELILDSQQNSLESETLDSKSLPVEEEEETLESESLPVEGEIASDPKDLILDSQQKTLESERLPMEGGMAWEPEDQILVSEQKTLESESLPVEGEIVSEPEDLILDSQHETLESKSFPIEGEITSQPDDLILDSEQETLGSESLPVEGEIASEPKDLILDSEQETLESKSHPVEGEIASQPNDLILDSKQKTLESKSLPVEGDIASQPDDLYLDSEQKTLESESLPVEGEIVSEPEDLILDSQQRTLESERLQVEGEIVSKPEDLIDEEQLIFKLESMLELSGKSSYKVIITRVNASTGTKGVIPVEPLSKEESLHLMQERVGRGVYDVPAIKSLVEAFIQKTKYMPASIILMAKTLSYIGQHGFGVGVLKRALEEVSTTECYNLNQLLRNGYDLVLPRSIIIDCCPRQSHFFLGRGKSIHYTELIAYWILEGYLGHVDCVEKAYEKGHSVFIELVDCQVLRKLEGGFVTVDNGTNRLEDSDHYRFGGKESLGLAGLFADGDWQGFGRLMYIDGMAKSICEGIKGLKFSTLFLNGNQCWEVLDRFLGSRQELKKELQVLALFNPASESLPKLLNEFHELVVFVLRGCDFLVEIDNKFDFKRLTVLEISNTRSLKKIPDKFFDHMPKLESLHISELMVNPLPPSIYNLEELRWLILRGCSCFQTLNSLKNLKKLLVLDVSGATSLEKFDDKAFNHTPHLQTLNLSFTSITLVPKLSNLSELTHLSLSGCERLERLRRTDSLPRLQVLDLSGARKFKEFHERSQGLPTCLKTLDLSETPLRDLPSSMNPRHLFLTRCSELQELKFTRTLQNLEVLDLSGTKSLVRVEDKFFSHLKSLQILNLSKTSIQKLPSLSNVSNLRQLLLSGCNSLTKIKNKSFEHMSCLEHLNLFDTRIKSLPSLSNLSNLSVLSLKKCTQLKELPPLEGLTNLGELNLCGVTCLKENKAEFLVHMSKLRILDLSETQLVELPSMSHLKSLHQLYLRGCHYLQRVPNLEELTTLEVLDLSGTAITLLPPMDNFINLRKLLLTGCPNLKEFLQMEMLDLLGAKVDQLPYGISNLTNLEFLDIPNMKITQPAESSNTNSPPEGGEPYHWGIFSFEKPSISVSGTLFVQFLERNRSVFETSFKQFHLCVRPTEAENKCRSSYSDKSNYLLRDIRFQAAEFCAFKEQRSLEICGFDLFPNGIEEVLSIADCVFFTSNTFIKWLSDISVSSLKAMKGCWIEGCTEMEGVFDMGKEDDIVEPGNKLKFLGISNAINLETTHGGRGFRNLTCLYLDCCPKLSTIFSLSHLPENLTVLQVKFCDILESVFDLEQTSPEPELQKLETLYLWELPELKSIGCRLPSLQTLTVWQCPKLQNLEHSIRFAESVQTLCTSKVVDLKSIHTRGEQLDTLIPESCPMLINVFRTSGHKVSQLSKSNHATN